MARTEKLKETILQYTSKEETPLHRMLGLIYRDYNFEYIEPNIKLIDDVYILTISIKNRKLLFGTIYKERTTLVNAIDARLTKYLNEYNFGCWSTTIYTVPEALCELYDVFTNLRFTNGYRTHSTIYKGVGVIFVMAHVPKSIGKNAITIQSVFLDAKNISHLGRCAYAPLNYDITTLHDYEKHRIENIVYCNDDKKAYTDIKTIANNVRDILESRVYDSTKDII